jgi:transposase
MEASGGSHYLYDLFSPHVAKVDLLDPISLGALINIYKKKNDLNDTSLTGRCYLAGAVPTVWVPDHQIRDERHYAQHRMDLAQEATRVGNRIQALFVEHGLAFRATELLKMDAHLLIAHLKTFMGKLALEKLASDLRMQAHVEEEIRLAEAHIVAISESHPDNDIAMSLPGIQHHLAFVIKAVVGTIDRFKTASSVPNYAGLVPSLHSSGTGKPKHGKITKRGSGILRWAAVEAAKNGVKVPGRFKDKLAKMLRKGKGYQQAIVACARELLEVLWHMLTKKEKYRELPLKSQQRKEGRRRQTVEKTQKTLHNLVDSRSSILANLPSVRGHIRSVARL